MIVNAYLLDQSYVDIKPTVLGREEVKSNTSRLNPNLLHGSLDA